MKRIKILEMRGICKSFDNVYANKDINLSVSSGEVLGLLGENGAGKTTLMNILYGLYKPDSGSILINGEPVKIRSPRDSAREGIGMIHQHFMLVQNHTVIENLALGYKDLPFFFPEKKMRSIVSELSGLYGLKIDPDKKVWELSAGEQQKIEILKALSGNADLLIMDEPTSVLTPQEASDLFSVIRKMKDEGHAVILISHKLDEILDICDRVAVLRKGEVVGEADIAKVDKKQLARMMIGRDVVFSFSKKDISPGRDVLTVEGLEVYGDRGLKAVNGVSFSVRENEIFGIAGVSGNGQQELAEAITGLRKSHSGKIELNGEQITNKGAASINSSGISHVPEERIKFGAVPNLAVLENSVLKKHRHGLFSRWFFLDYGKVKNHAEMIVERYQVSTPGVKVPVKNLSGGNIQKLIIGREIESGPHILVASHPTYGLDIGATEYVRNQLLDRREKGGAVLLISEDLEELFELCDRIAVIFKGEFMDVLDADHADLENIGLLMTGSSRGEKQ